jgi:hypothetical protein
MFKRFSASLILFYFLFNSGSAQNFKGGLVGGMVSSDVIGIDPYDLDFYKLGMQAGGFVQLALGADKSFQVELLYIRKGSYQPPDVQNNIYSFYRLQLNYIEMPFVFKKRLHFMNKTNAVDNFEVEAGAYLAVLLNTKHENEYGEFTDRAFHKTDPGLLFGASYYFSPNWALNLRFSGSLVPIRSHLSNSSYWLNSGEYNTVINYSLRYFFN